MVLLVIGLHTLRKVVFGGSFFLAEVLGSNDTPKRGGGGCVCVVWFA